ncbi:MAG: BA14K family protein [Rhodomicrobium sp.]|nr:BA14K family protein [Rhodomicrobium sp.]
MGQFATILSGTEIEYSRFPPELYWQVRNLHRACERRIKKMINLKRTVYSACFASALAFASVSAGATANATPLSAGIFKTTVESPKAATPARWDGRRGYGRHHRRHWHRHHDHDYNPGAYIALGIIGSLIERGLSEGAARSAMQRCDDRYRSFEWDTGYYTTYGGDKRLCPYLR